MLALGAEGAADPDLAGALGDRRQHDVHDPDPAHQEGDARDGAEDDVEDALGLRSAREQLERHDHLVVLVVVLPAQHLAAGRRDELDVDVTLRLHDDLVELDLLDVHGPAADLGLALAVERSPRGERKEDLAARLAGGIRGDAPRGEP